MKKPLFAIFLLALAGCGSAPEPSVDATAEFKPVLDKMYAAWSTLDPSKVAPYYAKDATLVFFDVAPFKYTGWKEYEEGFKKVTADWKSITVSVNPDLKATKNGNIVLVTYSLSFDIEPKTGDHMKAQLRGTDVFEKRGPGWLVIHEHVSTVMPDPPPAPTKKKAKAVRGKAARKKARN